MKKKNKFRWIERLLFVVFLVVFVISGYHVIDVLKDNHTEDKEIDNIKDEIKVPDPKDEKELDTFTIDFDYLKDRYPNVIGWIVVDDTSISYPIVQGEDNDYYLNHTYAGTENYAGSIFMDYRANRDFSDYNTFIYGHNVFRGTMFAELQNYMNADYFNSHPYIHLYTREGTYKLQVFSAYQDKTDSYGYQMYFNSPEQFDSYLQTVKSMSRVANDVEVNSNDHVISLYTCSYENGNNPENTDIEELDDRYFIHAKMIFESK